jgi:Zn ribbon nucleic-acid-binding protein
MNKIHDSKCPLCDAKATFAFCERNIIRYFQCVICTKFFISRSASSRLKKEPHRKANFSRMVASLRETGNILEITMVPVEGLHTEEVPPTNYLK